MYMCVTYGTIEMGLRRAERHSADFFVLGIDDEEDDEKSSKPTLICTNLPAECNTDIIGALLSQ